MLHHIYITVYNETFKYVKLIHTNKLVDLIGLKFSMTCGMTFFFIFYLNKLLKV